MSEREEMRLERKKAWFREEIIAICVIAQWRERERKWEKVRK